MNGFDSGQTTHLRARAPTLFKRANTTANDNAVPFIAEKIAA
jgi:hypothetical protein